MHISKDLQMSRRTALHGIGATVSLPFLEAMLPKAALASSASASAAIPGRMAIFYFGTGMNMREFEPAETGKNYTLPSTLKVLEPHRDDFTVFSGTHLEHGGGHHGDYTFSTGVQAKSGGQIKNSVSMDQIAAEHIGQETRYPSMQMCIQRGTGFGGNLRTLSWNRNGVPLASENDPHAIFNRLFGVDSPDEQAQRQKSFRRRGSILDVVLDDAKSLENTVGARDKEKLDEYFTSLREVEQQLQRNKDWATKPKPQVDTSDMGDFSKSYTQNMPAGQFTYDTYAKLMYDIIAMAFETDSTRVISYVVRQESGGGTFPEFNVSKGFHELTHHGNDPKNLAELAKVDRIYMDHWAYFLDRMKSYTQPDGSTLLDHSMMAFSSGMGIGHSKNRLPTCLFGGKQRGIDHQGHVKFSKDQPLSRVWHTMLDRLEVPVGENFQDSTGPIREIMA